MVAAEEIANDTSKNWDERIRAAAEIIYKERGEKKWNVKYQAAK